MSDTITHPVEKIDLQALTEVVRLGLGCPDFIIRDWSFGSLRHKGIINPDGLFRFHGNGYSPTCDQQADQSWSVVLKILKPLDFDMGPSELMYWKREVLLFQSGLLDRLPGPLIPPKVYKLEEKEEEFRVWMEFVEDISPPRWTVDEYVFAARQIGRMDGAYLTGEPIPDDDWLCHRQCRSWYEGGVKYLSDPDKVWNNPLVLRVYSGEKRLRMQRYLDDHELFISALDRLPRVFGHFDAQRRNLMVRRRPDGQPELVAIDWAMAGTGPVGGNLAMMIPNSAFFFEIKAADMPQVEPETFRAYLEGLREMGWQGREEMARLGYCAWVWPGMVLS